MLKLKKVRWTITATRPPEPWIACSGCGETKALRSSDRIRLNANGRRLDAWLIYKCQDCDRTWNRPLIERRNVRDIAPSVLEALQASEKTWVRAQAFDLDGLKRSARQVEEFADYEILRELVSEDPGWSKLVIELVVPWASCLRLDRLLSKELAIPRTKFETLVTVGALRLEARQPVNLRRRVRHDIVIMIDAAALPAGPAMNRPTA